MPADDRLRSDAVNGLLDAILQLKSRNEAYRFFQDVATPAEIRAFAQRWEVARKLDAGESIRQVAAGTGASTATVSRVSRCLQYGADGYRLVLDRVKAKRSGKT